MSIFCNFPTGYKLAIAVDRCKGKANPTSQTDYFRFGSIHIDPNQTVGVNDRRRAFEMIWKHTGYMPVELVFGYIDDVSATRPMDEAWEDDIIPVGRIFGVNDPAQAQAIWAYPQHTGRNGVG
jgi:hypothetical protein